MSYRYIHAESPKPDRWNGTHYLNCLHSLNSRSQIEYQMFCNILKTMPDGRLKIEVFGYRYFYRTSSINNSRIRYVDDWRVTDKCWNRII